MENAEIILESLETQDSFTTLASDLRSLLAEMDGEESTECVSLLTGATFTIEGL